MKPYYLWCFFIILLNQKDRIIDAQEEEELRLAKCYKTNTSACDEKGQAVYDNPDAPIDKETVLKCLRDAPESDVECGPDDKCGIVKILFENGDNLTFSGCETTNTDKKRPFLELCEKHANSERLQLFEKVYKMKVNHTCTTCDGDMCNSKYPATKKPIVTSSSPSPPKKEEKSDNSSVFPNLTLLMLLVLIICSF